MSEGAEKYESLDKPALISILLERDRNLEIFQANLTNANRKLYGTKSEKLTADQLKFTFDLPPQAEQPLLEQEVVVAEHKRTVQKGRKPLPGNLERNQIIYTPEQTHCSCCSKELVEIGREVSEELEYIPARAVVNEHIRIKLACGSCKGAGVLVPPLPPTVLPIERARPGAGLLAFIIVSKYVDHLPLYRQEQIFARQGIELPRQRMCDWITHVVHLLEPLYCTLKAEILLHSYIHADETTLKVQDNAVPGKCHTGYLWGLLGPPNLVWFHYAESRAGRVPKEILNGYQGAVHTDAYAGYNQVYIPDQCVRVACLAHIRRKFIEAQASSGEVTLHILKVIAELYKIDKRAKNKAELLELRTAKSKPLVDRLFEFMQDKLVHTLPKSKLAEALRYALNQKIEVTRIFESAVCDLDNNAIERQMRPVALGRKNYLFAGSHDGAHRAAVLYSLLNTCKLNKVNPWLWLSDVLKRIADPKGGSARELLPHNWRLRPVELTQAVGL